MDEFSVALDNDGFVPAPTMLVTGRPAPSALLKISIVTDPLGVPATSHPKSVPPNGILSGFLVPAERTDPDPSTARVIDLEDTPPEPLNPEYAEYPE